RHLPAPERNHLGPQAAMLGVEWRPAESHPFRAYAAATRYSGYVARALTTRFSIASAASRLHGPLTSRAKRKGRCRLRRPMIPAAQSIQPVLAARTPATGVPPYRCTRVPDRAATASPSV